MDTCSLVLQHQTPIVGAASRLWFTKPIVRSVLCEVEDAQQQAMCYCLRYGLRYWDQVVNQRLYFCRLAQRGIWDALQTTRHRKRLTLPDVQFIDYDIDIPAYDDGLEQVITRLDMLALIDSLSERERQMVVLRYGLGGLCEMSWRQISAQLGVTEATVRTTLHNAMKRLRSLQPDYCS